MSFFSRRLVILTGLSSVATAVTTQAQNVNAPRNARIIVVLADNKNQGIVPVPEKLGDGQEPQSNLYWGALYGVKTYFKRHPDWEVVSVQTRSNPYVLDTIKLRLITNEALTPVSVEAEAWDGAHMKKALKRFYDLAADSNSDDELIVFVGHNGLMDQFLSPPIATLAIANANRRRDRKAIVLACKSSQYFEDKLMDLGVIPYVMTKGLMAPEAYSLEAALKVWVKNGKPQKARLAAAKSYSSYQKIPEKNARWLFQASGN